MNVDIDNIMMNNVVHSMLTIHFLFFLIFHRMLMNSNMLNYYMCMDKQILDIKYYKGIHQLCIYHCMDNFKLMVLRLAPDLV